MIIKTSDGNTTRTFKAFTDRGALAHFLDSIEVGQSKTISGFVTVRGEEKSFPTLQAQIPSAKAPGTTYRTSAGETGLTVRRLA